jgi:two-component system sensor histidine kinase KdpD
MCRQAAGGLERVRLAEEARSAAVRAKTEEMRSSLLSAVSHDLRTPLASITGAATALRDDENLAEPTRAELVDSICGEAERLERLVANLLDMTRLESGAISLKRDWVPVDELIGSALTRLEAKLADRAVAVTLPPGLPLVLVDPVLFEQLLVNLLENAVKYTPAGSALELTARVLPGAAPGAAVELTVSDHGPGLPPGDEERVFTKFYRAPGGAAGVPGAGLGLAICRGIAEAHGGSIRALAGQGRRPGSGAVFVVTIPTGGPPPALPGGEPAEPGEAPVGPGALPATVEEEVS